MFWFAPLLGAAVTAIIYGQPMYISIAISIVILFACHSEYAPLKPKKRENKESMADAIFMAKKKRLG
jgi:hypothetical protein